MSYDDAIRILQSKGSEIQWGGDFGGTDETLLTEDRERPIMVDRFPPRSKRSISSRTPSGRSWCWAWTCSAPEGYGESSAAASASTTPSCCLRAHPGTQPAAGSL